MALQAVWQWKSWKQKTPSTVLDRTSGNRKKKFALHIRNETPQQRNAAGPGAKESQHVEKSSPVPTSHRCPTLVLLTPCLEVQQHTLHKPSASDSVHAAIAANEPEMDNGSGQAWYKPAALRAAPCWALRHIPVCWHLQRLHSYQQCWNIITCFHLRWL